MARQSLYRKYRPQTFEDVIGQEHIVRTLRNAVAEGEVAHAYLFCGPRGTGKTTTARILAKALNCEKGPTPDPDDTCEACREITEGRHPDVYELDAASSTGVDQVREAIITKVNYATTRGGHKIYIIDEVHMLSGPAFNALLKTVEEPPARTVFVLCTTHPHKVPETIHSRCQRFDFRRIGIDDIVRRLAMIAEREGITVEDGALPLIARHAAGGMRNAIGTLDQLAAFTGKQVALADVEGLLGEVDFARLAQIARLVAARDAAGCFRFVADLVESGADVGEFVRGLTAHFRDLYVLAAGADAHGVIASASEELEELREEVRLFDLDRLGRMLEVLGDLSAEMRWTTDPRLALEVALTRLARPASDLTLSALAERVSSLEAGHSAAARPASAPAASEPAAPGPPVASPPAGDVEAAVPEHADTAAPAPTPPATRPIVRGALDTAALRRAWPEVLREVKAMQPADSKLLAETEVDVDGDTVVVEFPSDQRVPMRVASEQERTTRLREAIERVTGLRVAIRYQIGRGAVRRDAGEGGSERSDAAPSRDAAAVPASPPPPVPPEDADEAPRPAADQGHEVVSRSSDVERMLMDELGAEVVAESPPET